MKLINKSMLMIGALLTLYSCGVTNRSANNQKEEHSIRVGTYNLWVTASGKGDYAWECRKDRLARSIADIDFDVFGAQEVDLRHQGELPELLIKHGAAEYSWFVFSPYSQDGKGDKAQAILYKKSRFVLVDSISFWISETPEVMSTGWDEIKYTRGASAVILKDNHSGKKFIFMNSHFPLAKEAKVHAAELVNRMAEKFNSDSLPAFFVGDLNTSPEMRGAEILRSYWKDSFLTTPDELKEGSSGTFTRRDTNMDMSKAKRIDYVYYRGKVNILKYCCYNQKYDGFWPSDHCAVYVDASL